MIEKSSPKNRLLERLLHAYQIVYDNNSYLYLTSEHQNDMKKYKLGRGTFTGAISLFALLNYLSKIYYILDKGSTVFVGEKELLKFEELKEKIKSNQELNWKEFKHYFRKPRKGDINETNAFSNLIMNCPINFGIKIDDKNEIENVWRHFRNKLTHLISLSGDVESGQLLMETIIQPGGHGMYEVNKKFIEGRMESYKAFDFPSDEIKSAFLKKDDIDTRWLQQIVKDKCYVDRLNITCRKLINWLIQEINNDNFTEDNIKSLNIWLDNELT